VEPLRATLFDHFGQTTLGGLQKQVCVTALRVDGKASAEVYPTQQTGFWRPAVFTNMPAVPGVTPDVDLSCVDACLRSSAAPTFFPIHDGYADGGLWANNPSTVALAKTLLHFPGLRRTDVKILSIGTGQWRNAVVTAQPDLGLLQWAPYLLDLLLDASSLNTDLAANFLLRDNYCRLSPSFDVPIQLDDHRAVQRLLDLADNADIDHAVAFVQRALAHQEQQHLDDHHHHHHPDDVEANNHVSPPSSPNDDDDHLGDVAPESFEILGGSAGRLHSAQWAELVDLAWIDAVRPRRRQVPRRGGGGDPWPGGGGGGERR